MYEVNSKLRSSDRILVLRPKDGKKPKATSGLVDPRLFSGEHNLHAIMDEATTLWSFKYEHGILPNPLKQKFTSFNKLFKYAQDYFGRRDLEIVEVKD